MSLQLRRLTLLKQSAACSSSPTRPFSVKWRPEHTPSSSGDRMSSDTADSSSTLGEMFCGERINHLINLLALLINQMISRRGWLRYVKGDVLDLIRWSIYWWPANCCRAECPVRRGQPRLCVVRGWITTAVREPCSLKKFALQEPKKTSYFQISAQFESVQWGFEWFS